MIEDDHNKMSKTSRTAELSAMSNLVFLSNGNFHVKINVNCHSQHILLP